MTKLPYDKLKFLTAEGKTLNPMFHNSMELSKYQYGKSHIIMSNITGHICSLHDSELIDFKGYTTLATFTNQTLKKYDRYELWNTATKLFNEVAEKLEPNWMEGFFEG